VQAQITVINVDAWLTMRPRLYEAFSPDLRVPLGPLLQPLDIHLEIGSGLPALTLSTVVL